MIERRTPGSASPTSQGNHHSGEEVNMNTITINSELVGQITSLVQAWNTADRRIREMFHGWEQRATRAGLERGFYMQVGSLPGAESIADLDDAEAIGRAVYAAYMQGGVVANIDTL